MTFGLPPLSFGSHVVVVVIRKVELDGTASAAFLTLFSRSLSRFLRSNETGFDCSAATILGRALLLAGEPDAMGVAELNSSPRSP